MEFQRSCPKCGLILGYKRRKHLDRAERNASLCGPCANPKKGFKAPLLKKRFGSLVVVEKLGRRGKTRYCHWLCRCDCGGETIAPTNNLNSGHTTSCGCKAGRKFNPTEFDPCAEKRPFEALYNYLKCSRSRLRVVPVELSYEEFLEFTAIGECHYCGEPVKWAERNLSKTRSHATNLDRKNNSLGYSKNNCVVCCFPCNRSKGDKFSYEEFMVMMKALQGYRKNKLKALGAVPC